MKLNAKIFCSVLLLISIMPFTAFAKQKNTEKGKLDGVQFGVAVPLVTPLTGYNVFVGYVNKNAETFLGRRFGLRADFTIPTGIKVRGRLSDSDEMSDDNKPQYAVDGDVSLLGFKLKSSTFTDEKFNIEAFKDDRDNYIRVGQDAATLSLDIKNKNMGLLVDFYPFANTWFLGGIRLTGGYYLGDFDISANVKFNNDINYSYKLGDNGNVLHAQVAGGSHMGANFHWKYDGPYAGLGFDLGIWRGFKFFMDAGVVFANAPKMTAKNINDSNLRVRARYEIYNPDGTPYSTGDEMVDILQDGISAAPDVDKIVQDTVGMVVRDTLNSYRDEYPDVIAQIGNFTDKDFSELGTDVLNFLNDDSQNGENTADWIKTLQDNYSTTELNDTLKDIKKEWKSNAANATDGIQEDINKAWQDYDDAKHDFIDDVNDFLKDYGMMPMFKIGFMYRF